MQGHIDEGLSTGRGFSIVTLTDHNINIRSSTKSEINGLHDCMLDVFWTRYFMEAQGYQVMEKLFTKTTIVTLSWRRMGIHQVEIAPITPTLFSFSSLTVSGIRN